MTISLYECLSNNNQIKEKKYTIRPHRTRAKKFGYMWEGKLEVRLQDARIYIFSLHHHFDKDDGTEEWKPTECEIMKNIYCTFIPSKDSKNNFILIDALWHKLYHEGHYYLSNKIVRAGSPWYNTCKQQLKDGSWKNNPDLELLC